MNADTLQDVLAKIETLDLNEGVYLQLANLLKKEFEKTSNIIRTQTYDIMLTFSGETEIKIAIKEKRIIHGPVSDTILYEINGIAFQSCNAEMIDRLSRLYRSNLTASIAMTTAGITYEHDLETWVTQIAQTNRALRNIDDDDDEYDYRLQYVLNEIIDA